jgi:hypothetical protein
MNSTTFRPSTGTRRVILAVAAGATLAAAPLVQAQPWGGARGPVDFDTIDTDHNGVVSAAEFAQHRALRMAARAAEGRMLRNAGQAPSFESLDRNGNGGLEPDELPRGSQGRFAARGPGAGGGPGGCPR